MTLGPWIQDPDYDAPVFSSGDTVISNWFQLGSVFTDVGSPLTPDGRQDYLDAAIFRVPLGTSWLDNLLPAGVYTSEISFDVYIGGPPGSTSYSGSRLFQPLFFRADSTWSPPAPPPGAIGVEVEDGATNASVQAASLTDVTWRRYAWDATIGAPLADGDWIDHFYAFNNVPVVAGDFVWDGIAQLGTEAGEVYTSPRASTSAPDIGETELLDPMDLTPYLFGDPTEGLAVVASLTEVTASPTEGNLNALVDNNLFMGGTWDGGRVGGTTTSPTMIYTLRPPRYRWIFADVPARRLWPRQDGLGLGLGRTWPRPDTYQAGRLGPGSPP